MELCFLESQEDSSLLIHLMQCKYPILILIVYIEETNPILHPILSLYM